jgi:hypothetical protein
VIIYFRVVRRLGRALVLLCWFAGAAPIVNRFPSPPFTPAPNTKGPAVPVPFTWGRPPGVAAGEDGCEPKANGLLGWDVGVGAPNVKGVVARLSLCKGWDA